jgi:hypothetical protein
MTTTWRRSGLVLALVTVGIAARLGAQGSTDSGFAKVQTRGAMVMGVDQTRSHHVFEDLPDGGRIIYTVDDQADTGGTLMIRHHLSQIQDRFAAGDFSDPSRVHDLTVPGTGTMTRLRDRIHYRFTERPGGAELGISSDDPEARAAIHDFLTFQRMDHRAPGHEDSTGHHHPS